MGAPFIYGGYYAYGYGDGCYWLRSRALYTGSPYWWNRYYACVNGYAAIKPQPHRSIIAIRPYSADQSG